MRIQLISIGAFLLGNLSSGCGDGPSAPSSSTTGGRGSIGGAGNSVGGENVNNLGGAPTQGGSGQVGGTAPATTGTPATTNKAFSQCRFHFGISNLNAIANSAGTAVTDSTTAAQMDYGVGPWMGTESDSFASSGGQAWACKLMSASGALNNMIAVQYSYIAAAYAKRHYSLCDCNVSGCSGGNLCSYGAQYIGNNWSTILTVFENFAQGWAGCYGTTRPLVILMEPDWYQYTYATQTGGGWSYSQAGAYMAQAVAAMRKFLPNAYFSMDISPWVATSKTVSGNGADNGAGWFANFTMSDFTFVNTSGGDTSASTAKIRTENLMTWAGVGQVTGKPILAHVGSDTAWDSVSNLNLRIADGVIAVSKYAPAGNWASTISSIRSQLNTPKFCP